ncbi:hypothetical protein D3C72_1353830 [compost metagenome]
MPIGKIIGIGEPHQPFENVLFLADGISFFGHQFGVEIRKMLQGIHVSIELVIQATFQFPALSR